MSHTEFKSDNVVVKVSREPGCQVMLDIRITPVAANASYQKAIKNVNKEISIPGFRKGKAPADLIVQQFGKHVEQEWREILIQTAYQEAIKLTNIYPLNKDSIKQPNLKKASKEDGAEISISFESAPEIPSVETDKINLKKVERIEVTSEDVENSIQKIRVMQAKWEDVTDRAVQEGDYIDIDIDNLDESGKSICKDTCFEVTKGKLGDWMRKLVIGLKVGENAEGVSERTEDLPKDAKFKPTKCRITIKGIKQAKLPKLDDEFAKKVGVQGVEELKKRVEIDLNRQADEEVQEKLRQQLEDVLLEKYPFDIPTSLITAEKQNRLNKVHAQLKSANISEEEIKKRMQEMEGNIEKEAERAFRMFYLAQKVAEDHNITISKDEMIKETVLDLYMQSPDLRSSQNSEEARTRVYIRLLSRKAKDYLIERAGLMD